MPDDNYAVLVDDDGLAEAVHTNRGCELVDSCSAPFARILGIGFRPIDGPEFDLHPVRVDQNPIRDTCDICGSMCFAAGGDWHHLSRALLARCSSNTKPALQSSTVDRKKFLGGLPHLQQ